jgi:serine/threonine protein phosphatase PrpC
MLTAYSMESGDKEIDDKKIAFFAVFDGHGGPNVAKFAGAQLQ